MKAKNCLIFGGTGQIGTSLIRKLVKNNYKVTVVTRNLHQKGNFVKTQANAGYIDIVEANPFDEEVLNKLFQKADICINLVGILYESGKNNTFKNIHTNFPDVLSKLANLHNLEQFIHVSALGIDEAKTSVYAKSKVEGEKKIKENFPRALILRPSIVYSVDDNFTTLFMTLINRLPIFPIYYNGATKFMPIHCSDLTDIIQHSIEKEINSKIVQCVGPETLTFKELVQTLMNLIDKKRLLIPMPLFFAKIIASAMEILPKPLLTRDQLNLLNFDNISSGSYDTNSSIGVPSKKLFSEEVKKYCYMWRDGGQFSTERYESSE